MSVFRYMMVAGAMLGLAFGGLVAPASAENVFWAEVCGRPGMRIAIPLGDGDPEEDRRNCAEACHAALCRKTIDTIRKADGRGAVV